MRKFVCYGLAAVIVLNSLLTGCGGDEAEEVLQQTQGFEGITGKDGAPMVLIPAGEFEMGDHFKEGDLNERPVHTVYLDAFYMDVYEVTNARYATFLNEVGDYRGDGGQVWLDIGDEEERDEASIELVGGQYHPKPGFEDHPVIKVSWYGAATYAQWASKRLPTEAEWEKAARGGLVGKRYPWRDEAPNEGEQYRANYDPQEADADGYVRTAPVGSFPPNGYSLYDMVGNVCEWCMDGWSSSFYSRSPRENPVAWGIISFVDNNFANVRSLRGLRGGSWLADPYSLRVANRNYNTPERTYPFIGFRCAASDAP